MSDAPTDCPYHAADLVCPVCAPSPEARASWDALTNEITGDWFTHSTTNVGGVDVPYADWLADVIACAGDAPIPPDVSRRIRDRSADLARQFRAQSGESVRDPRAETSHPTTQRASRLVGYLRRLADRLDRG